MRYRALEELPLVVVKTYGVWEVDDGEQGRKVSLEPMSHDDAVALAERLNAQVAKIERESVGA